jgi:hypothetical protein
MGEGETTQAIVTAQGHQAVFVGHLEKDAIAMGVVALEFGRFFAILDGSRKRSGEARNFQVTKNALKSNSYLYEPRGGHDRVR